MNKWELIGYIKASKYRESVLLALNDKNLMPKELADILSTRTNHISRTLKELEKHQLIECLNPNLKKGRLYAISDEGKSIVESYFQES